MENAFGVVGLDTEHEEEDATEQGAKNKKSLKMRRQVMDVMIMMEDVMLIHQKRRLQ
jgi:hypothetical protein